MYCLFQTCQIKYNHTIKFQIKHVQFISGMQAVYMSLSDGGLSNETYELSAGKQTLKLHGILCENGKLQTYKFNVFCV